MRNARHCVRGSAGLGLAALALLLAGPTTQAQQANYPLPKQPTAQSGNIHYYAVPMGYTWDHFAYIPNPGDWNLAIGDTGFDAGPIPNNPTYCGPRGEACTSDAGGAKSTSFITTNNDPTHGYSNIPLLIGPTQDGYNNVQVAYGQSIPVVPGRYGALFVTYTMVCGPDPRMLVLNYTDGADARVLRWADWCNPAGATPDFFTWRPFHRLRGDSIDNNSCALITKFVPVNPNRTLTSITIGADVSANGVVLPGDTITGNCSRLVIGGMTLASADPNLGGYGMVSGRVVNAAGETQTTPAHANQPDAGFDVFVVDPPLGNYGAAANVDGTFSLGLPAGTYTLNVAKRYEGGEPRSAGPQGTPITVTVEAGKVTVQNVTVTNTPNPNFWGELTGTVKDASGNPVAGAAILVSTSPTGPFTAVAINQEDEGTLNTTFGLTPAEGTFTIRGLNASKPIYVMASGGGFASATPVEVSLTGGGSKSQDITVAQLQVGNIRGSVVTPEGHFGGIGVPVTLTGRNASFTTTTRREPPSSAEIPETGVTAAFEFENIPAGEYTVSLPASASQGAAAETKVTVTAGQTVTPTLTLTYPAWNEGTPDAAISDPLNGTSLNAKWTAADVGAPSAPGSVQASANGLTVTADGGGWNGGSDDSFFFVSQKIPAEGNWVAYVTVTAVPSTDPAAAAGLMIASPNEAAASRRANFVLQATNGTGVRAEGRLADGNTTFPYIQTAVGTNPENPDSPGTQPGLPITLKIRKVGNSIAGFYSTDGGKTQRLIGHLSPQFDPGQLLLGLATTSGVDGTTDTATYRDFVFAPLTTAQQPATNPTAGQ